MSSKPIFIPQAAAFKFGLNSTVSGQIGPCMGCLIVCNLSHRVESSLSTLRPRLSPTDIVEPALISVYNHLLLTCTSYRFRFCWSYDLAMRYLEG